MPLAGMPLTPAHPQGIIVSVPVFYATGSRRRGLLWAAVSGAAEPFGALIGFAALSASGTDMPALAYGLIFAAVAGIMAYISLCELLPAAVRHDPEDRVTRPALFAGMAVMAASILLFET
jgi:ZIP family zinc transporter